MVDGHETYSVATEHGLWPSSIIYGRKAVSITTEIIYGHRTDFMPIALQHVAGSVAVSRFYLTTRIHWRA